MLILVISLSVVVVLLLVSIIVCVVRRKQKESPSVQEPGEVRHNLMAPPAPPPGGGGGASSEVYSAKCEQPLPPPPTPTQWSHLYTDNSSYYDGNTYEVPHHHPGKTPPPTPFGTLLPYGGGYTGYAAYPRADSGHPPSLASSHYGPQHPISLYHYHDRQPL